ncbi:MAG: hypothetical protein IJ358_01730, partial [Clostridia bacterium]|nr:hypothetical protein [Clostridia bacterium]
MWGYIIEQGSSKLELNYVPDVEMLADDPSGGHVDTGTSGDTTTEEIVIEDDVSSSPISVPTKIYKYAFTNTSSTTSAIGLNSIP